MDEKELKEFQIELSDLLDELEDAAWEQKDYLIGDIRQKIDIAIDNLTGNEEETPCID